MSTVWDVNDSLFDDYAAFFKKLGIEIIDYTTLNRFDQIHAGGIKATEKIAEKAGLTPGTGVLELGGGIGGVARFLSQRYRLNVVNLDLSWSYSITGKKLTELVNPPPDHVFFVNADALQIPFKNSVFDAVWLQHVNMNISDKDLLFSEIRRVINPGGKLLFHEWFTNDSSKGQVASSTVTAESWNSELISFPLPWADDAAYNHLMTFDAFYNLAKHHGFILDFSEDESEISLKFYKKLLETKAFNNPIFKGRTPQKIFENTISMLESGALKVYSGKLKETS